METENNQNIHIPEATFTKGTISRRLLAYFVDFFVIACLTGAFYFAVAVLGLVTFGLAWSIFAVPGCFLAILYSALTVSSPAQGTIGMRIAGVRLVEAGTRNTVPALTAAVHALFFYISVVSVVLFFMNTIIGIARTDRRFGHDLLAGIVAYRT